MSRFRLLIAQRRSELRLTQRAVSRAAGISAQFYCDLERGHRERPSPEIAFKIAFALNLPHEMVVDAVVADFAGHYAMPHVALTVPA